MLSDLFFNQFGKRKKYNGKDNLNSVGNNNEHLISFITVKG